MRNYWLKALLVLGLLVMSLALVPGIASAEEAVENGGFSDGLNQWYVNDALVNWDPLVDGTVSLHPNQMSFIGTIISQNLNMAEISNKTVSVSFKLFKTNASTGNTIAVYLDYLDNNDQRQKVKVLNPDNDSVGEWTYHSDTYTFPASARKLVKLSLAKENYGDFWVDDVSLQAEGITIGAKPMIHNISQGQGNYGSTIAINGEHFGSAYVANKSFVSIGGSTTGVNIQNWTDTQIIVQVQEPASGGQIMVTNDFVESNNNFLFKVTSPYFTVSVLNPKIKIIQGETARFVVRVDLMNNFTTENGIGFFVQEQQNAVFSPVPIKRSGGVSLSIDTTNLAPGTYNWHVQSLEDHSYARVVPITIEVATVDDIEFYTFDAAYNKVVLTTSLNVSNQGLVTVYYSAIDAYGHELSGAPVTLTSGNPGKLVVFPNSWGGNEIYALDNGTVDLVATTPDGFSKSLTVNINILPDSPRILSIGLSPTQVTNKGDQTITLGATATGPVGIGYNFNLVDDNGDWTNDTKTYQSTFKITEGEKPGVYLLYAFTFTGDWSTWQETSRAVVPLTIINDPSMGEIRGTVEMLEQGAFMPDVGGTLELYDASGNKVHEYSLWSMTNEYSVPYVSPGTYRLRFVPSSPNLSPQWYPNATSFAGAADVQVTAGEVSEGIDFFLRPVPPLVPSIQTVSVSVDSHEAGAAQEVNIDVTTLNVANGTTVTADLVSPAGVPATPAVSNSAAINNNSASLTLSIPADVAAGDYRIKVTIGTSPGIIDETTGYVITSPEPVAGDVNGDGQVSSTDLGMLADHYGQSGVDAKFDLVSDGMIDLYDLVRLARRIGK
ncbi:MAG: dockerin type I domain-containing protein [Bacillota bacterium]